MIIFNISGGLGNQLFQYAFGRSLAIAGNEDLYLCDSSFTKDKARMLRLGYFNTHYKMLDEAETKPYRSLYNQLHPLLKKWYRLYAPIGMSSFFSDKTEPWFQRKLLKATKGYFDGYWANEKYFNYAKESLAIELQLKEQYITPAFSIWKKRIQTGNSVAIHVRRGDYASNPVYNKQFGLLELSYYINSIECLKAQMNHPEFYVFTDDRQWATEAFGVYGLDYQFIEEKTLQSDYIEFALMRYCQHFIIANSTFSWWAAWLGQKEDSIVIAPKTWYADTGWQNDYESSDFIPSNWLKIA